MVSAQGLFIGIRGFNFNGLYFLQPCPRSKGIFPGVIVLAAESNGVFRWHGA